MRVNWKKKCSDFTGVVMSLLSARLCSILGNQERKRTKEWRNTEFDATLEEYIFRRRKNETYVDNNKNMETLMILGNKRGRKRSIKSGAPVLFLQFIR
uniref:Uncharacterized protein n=1 Tax=Megaselia scalaris TaxID=36166 RepID=T1GKG7_MEGSC